MTRSPGRKAIGERVHLGDKEVVTEAFVVSTSYHCITYCIRI